MSLPPRLSSIKVRRPFRPRAPLSDVTRRSNLRCCFSTAAESRRVLVRTAGIPVSRVDINNLPLFNLPINSRSVHAPYIQPRLNYSSCSLPAKANNPCNDEAPIRTIAAPTATFADLFCGVGSATLALSNLGLKCVYANDNNDLAAKTYEQNHSRGQRFVDRRNFAHVVWEFLDEIPRANILAASLPLVVVPTEAMSCEIQKILDCFLQLIQHQRNEVVVLEFEKKTVASGAFSIERICQLLDQAGYWIDWEVYCAASFGIPRYSEHIVAVAVRKDLIPVPFRPPRAEREPDRTLELKDLLLSYDEYQRLNQDRHPNKEEEPEMMDGALVLFNNERKIQRDKNRRVVLDHRDPLARPSCASEYMVCRAGVWEVFSDSSVHIRRRIYHHRGWAGVVSGRGCRDMSYYLTLGPEDGQGGVVPCIRRLHPREGARLKGLPDFFHLPEDQPAAWSLLGPVVPWRILQWPLQQLVQNYAHIFEPSRSKMQPPPGWPGEYPSHLPRSYKKGVINPSKVYFMKRLKERREREG